MSMFEGGAVRSAHTDSLQALAHGGAQAPHDLPADPPACEATPLLSLGRYVSDPRLHRSDLTRDADSPRGVEGLPLYLAIRVYSTSTPAHIALPGVQIDVCHCDAQGRYSGNAAHGSAGRTWLRGHQFSDADGAVIFRTVYPGWQSGRAVHIHLVARYYDRTGHTSFEYATDLFFDDAISDAVHAQAPYDAHGTRDTRNADDLRFAARAERLLRLRATGDRSPGYLGEIALGLALRACS